jgi:hypothetical protein
VSYPLNDGISANAGKKLSAQLAICENIEDDGKIKCFTFFSMLNMQVLERLLHQHMQEATGA